MVPGQDMGWGNGKKSKISTVRLGLASCGVELGLRTKVILLCLMLQKAPFSTKIDILAKLCFLPLSQT